MSYRSLFAWSVFLVLGLGVIAHETTDIFQKEPPPKTGQLPMFSFSEQDLGRVEILFQGKSAFLQRNDQGNWFRHDSGHTHPVVDSHSHTNSDNHHQEQGLSPEITKQLDITARMIADRKLFPEERADNHYHGTVEQMHEEVNSCPEKMNGCLGLDRFGLENPEIIFSFYPKETNEAGSFKPLDILYVGDMLPSQYTYYALKDSDNEVYLIPRYSVTMLLAVTFGADEAPTPRPVK